MGYIQPASPAEKILMAQGNSERQPVVATSAFRWLRWTLRAVVLFIIIVLIGGTMGFLSGKRPDNLGARDGQLSSVVDKPQNSVSSQTDQSANKIEPLRTGDDPASAMMKLKSLVEASSGATIIEQTDTYLYAEFQSRLLKFVDDVEFLLAPEEQVIQIRSASRLGIRDFDANRNRIEQLRQQFGESTATGASSAAPQPPTGESQVEFTTLPNGLQMADIEVGDGAEAAAGQQVTVHYTGWLYENGATGAKFDSSKDRDQPFQFGLGAGQVIRGWDEGVLGMKVGGKRHLIIPPEMGYGARGAGGVIPPNATLMFEVELLGV